MVRCELPAVPRQYDYDLNGDRSASLRISGSCDLMVDNREGFYVVVNKACCYDSIWSGMGSERIER